VQAALKERNDKASAEPEIDRQDLDLHHDKMQNSELGREAMFAGMDSHTISIATAQRSKDEDDMAPANIG
jgi:hypothetical protein